ncbi:MAG: hypothetical protein IJQ16_08175 [Selenomonadaceae bacterium]|nr:hypothetical protein [Selenomonadaceae bacterium]
MFAKKYLHKSDDDWSESLDSSAIKTLLDEGFSKDMVLATIVKCSPTVPSREDIQNELDDYSKRAASHR